MYKVSATPITEKDSKIKALHQEGTSVTKARLTASQGQSSRSSCTSSSKDRPLPKWMVSQKAPQKKKTLFRQDSSLSSLETNK